jgi:hypothetical protein
MMNWQNGNAICPSEGVRERFVTPTKSSVNQSGFCPFDMAKVVTLVHPEAPLPVPTPLLVSKCDLFSDNPGLVVSPYAVQSPVSLSDFREFVLALEGTTVKVTNDNFSGLLHLCAEFAFRALFARLLQFRDSRDFQEDTIQDTKLRFPIPMTEMSHCVALHEEGFTFLAENATFECSVGHAIALSPAVREQLSVDACAHTFSLRDATAVDSVRRLLSGDEVSVMRSRAGLGPQLHSPGLELALAQTGPLDLTTLDLSMLSIEALDNILAGTSFSIASEDDLLERLLNLGDEYHPLLGRIGIRFLSCAGLTILAEHFAFLPEWVCSDILRWLLHPPPPPPPPPPRPPRGWNSAIVPVFPELFEDFKEKQFDLLWRGSRDGFGARDFHSRCDGHANTLTVILDTNGNIFGGFTPVEWESRVWDGKASTCKKLLKTDPSLKSFLFTLKNPDNVPARKFPLIATKKPVALGCHGNGGPDFCDIIIYSNCNTSTGNFTSLGYRFTNDTGKHVPSFLTGSNTFQVEEIEIFEIMDETALPPNPASGLVANSFGKRFSHRFFRLNG